MGIGLARRSSCRCTPEIKIVERIINLPNPDPNNYKIIRYEHVLRNLVVEIKYPDCTNYEGVKILLYLNTTISDIKDKSIDPHFCENHKSPFARFEPTKEGWEAAIYLAQKL